MATKTKKPGVAAPSDSKNTVTTALIMTEAVAAGQLPKLSELLQPQDFEHSTVKYWRLNKLSDDVQKMADDKTAKEFKELAQKVADFADVRDLVILNEAIRDWFDFNGEDRVQAGYLIAAILFAAGATTVGNAENDLLIQRSAMRQATARLRQSGVQYVDDSAPEGQ